MKRDYYEVLGVPRDADDRSIKSAYRALAMKFHPDRNPGAEAEESFKEASEAYEVLSAPEKRRLYDRAGFDGLRDTGLGGAGHAGVEEIFSNFGDIFGDLFGGASRRRGGRARGGDLKVDLTLDFLEAAFGCKKTLGVDRHAECGHCGGRGAEPGSQLTRCGACDGRGQVVHGQGMFLVSTPCAECRGRGTYNPNPCRECHGDGKVRSRHELEVTVPPGFDEGLHLRYSGEGEAGGGGAPPGDLYVAVHIRAHKTLKRDGEDVVAELAVPLTVAMLGGELTLEGLEGPEVVQIAKGTQPNEIITLRKKGVPRLRGGGRGNLHVLCKVEVPRGLTKEQRALVEKLAESFGARPPKKRSLFS